MKKQKYAGTPAAYRKLSIPEFSLQFPKKSFVPFFRDPLYYNSKAVELQRHYFWHYSVYLTMLALWLSFSGYIFLFWKKNCAVTWGIKSSHQSFWKWKERFSVSYVSTNQRILGVHYHNSCNDNCPVLHGWAVIGQSIFILDQHQLVYVIPVANLRETEG